MRSNKLFSTTTSFQHRRGPFSSPEASLIVEIKRANCLKMGGNYVKKSVERKCKRPRKLSAGDDFPLTVFPRAPRFFFFNFPVPSLFPPFSRRFSTAEKGEHGLQNKYFTLTWFLCRYNLLFYINPQLYGYSAITKVLLQDIRLPCEYESILNCISTDGNAVLARFYFDSVNPYENLMVSVTLGVSSPQPILDIC